MNGDQMRAGSPKQQTYGDNPTKSQYKGVTWHPKTRKWLARIHVNRKQISLGYHDTEEAAAYAYDRAAVEHFKDKARLNFPAQEG